MKAGHVSVIAVPLALLPVPSIHVQAAQAAERAAPRFPVRPLRLVVGLPVGGSTDVVARIVAAGLTETLGQNVVVDNRTGRSGIIAGEKVASDVFPDGHTVLFGASFYAEVLATVEGSLPYRPLQDLAGISLVTKIPNVLVVYPGLPVKSVAELIAYAKHQKKELAYASSGNGSSAHLGMEMFKRRTAMPALHVPYKGAPQALADLTNGRIAMMFGNIPAQLPHVRSGKTRALAVTSSERSFQLPDVPTVSEAGVPGFEITVWYGIVAPAAVPRAILDAWNSALNRTLAAAPVRDRMMEQGAVPMPTSRQAFETFREREFGTWVPLVREMGIASSH